MKKQNLFLLVTLTVGLLQPMSMVFAAQSSTLNQTTLNKGGKTSLYSTMETTSGTENVLTTATTTESSDSTIKSRTDVVPAETTKETATKTSKIPESSEQPSTTSNTSDSKAKASIDNSTENSSTINDHEITNENVAITWGDIRCAWDSNTRTLGLYGKGSLKDVKKAPWKTGFIQANDIQTISFVGVDDRAKAPKDSSNMFADLPNLSKIILSGLDTQDVSNMRSMFSGDTSLTNLDLSSFNTQNVNEMSEMFSGDTSLKTLNLSSFDTQKLDDNAMYCMFDKANSLNELVLGSNFKFEVKKSVSYSKLVNPPNNEKYTGNWQNIGKDGTKENPVGENIWSTEEFVTNYQGSKDADIYVWQPRSSAGSFEWSVPDNFIFTDITISSKPQESSLKDANQGKTTFIDTLPRLSKQNRKVLVSYDLSDPTTADWINSGVSLSLNPKSTSPYIEAFSVKVDSKVTPLIIFNEDKKESSYYSGSIDVLPKVTVPQNILAKRYSVVIDWVIEQSPSKD
ncbi:BspA family leucine-rich repeat surface protein [Enterococcus sp. DIV0086]|uniref:BspA family leucine-rich repeat surface protein n=1 Tax=Enterococcus sp. DIV0086 TaxID=2774655 RepID=UPI003D2B4421